MRPMRALVTAVLAVFIVSCNSVKSPSSPSGIDHADLQSWYPCVIVQTPGGNALDVQMDAAKKLHDAGRMQWIRFGHTDVNGSTMPYYDRARSLGLNIFSIVSLDQLEANGWEQTFDRLYATYPSDIWEIAGEVTNGDIYVNPQGATTIEAFMPKFRRLYEYVKKNHPEAVLTTPPTFGSVGGPGDLEKFIKLGILDMDVILTVNIYTENALQEYGVVFDRYRSQLANKRIWVTETGASSPEEQINWVRNFYPRIINTVHPEMTCWYVMWGGDGTAQGDNGFGLLNNVQNGPVVERDLFKALAGGR